MRLLAALCLLLVGCTSINPSVQFRAQAAGMSPAELKLEEAQGALYFGEVDQPNMLVFLKGFQERVRAGDKHIVIRVDSPGGLVFLGMDVIKIIEEVKKTNQVKVTCMVDSMAASMALVFLQSPVCDQRLMTKRSLLMAHGASVALQGNVEDMRRAADTIEALNTAMNAIVSARLTISLEEYEERISHGRDWWISWKDAGKLGFVDGFIKPSDIPPLFP